MCNHQNQDLEKIGPPEKMRIPGKTPGVSASGRLSLGLVDRISAASQLFLPPRVAGSNPTGPTILGVHQRPTASTFVQ